ncbi:DUF1735 domain-containing protein [Pedobacter sandarakinus]|uniref:DUF1735 domain-containing protein n=1 Tax=Pedobacter sandarakinus TaxID=353156 RepID=UPI00224708F8|nr:DUF1735 domain-containing protein [Pedobacter sandarakinus]MCX2573674.1 DUF1735 domain-containing protein [Pedobacter sandarakinus]
MKKIFKLSAVLLTTAIFLSSCLKDDSNVLDPEKGVNVIEFANPTDIDVHGSSVPAYLFSYEVTPEETIPVSVSYSGPEPVAPQDITVNLAIGDNTNVTAYNSEQSKSYTLLPAASYTLSSTSVVIPKGQRRATVNVKVKPNTFNLASTYALPLKITSASMGVISGNFNTILLVVSAKNKYDGVYTYTATMTAPDRPTFQIGTEFTYAYDVQLRSSGAASNNLFNTAFGDFLIPLVTSTGGTSGFGSTNLTINFDAATNKVISVANAITNPANGRTMTLDTTATGSNFYDPATKTVYVTFFMNQPGFSPLKIVAKMKFKSAR